MVLVSIPAALDDDHDDVRWALSTAADLLSRGQKKQALGWLRHAAHSAEQAGAMPRAGQLFTAAANLASALDPDAMERTAHGIKAITGAPTARPTEATLKDMPLVVKKAIGESTLPNQPFGERTMAAGLPASSTASSGTEMKNVGESTLAVRVDTLQEAMRAAKVSDETLAGSSDALRVAIYPNPAGALVAFAPKEGKLPTGVASAILTPSSPADAKLILDMLRALKSGS